MFQLFLLTIGFITLSGVLAMIDAAILSVTPGEVEELIGQKKIGARALKRLVRHMTRAISVIVVLTNITNILGPILVGQKTVQLFGSTAIGIITALLTLLTIIFSEIIPKAIGSHYAPTIGRFVAPFLNAMIIILFPFVWLLERAVRLFKSGKRRVGTEEQIRALANIGGKAGHIDIDEKELIHRAFILNDKRVREIMTPRDRIIVVPDKATVREAAQFVFDHSYSRYPVFKESLDDIHGFILSRDVLASLANGHDSEPITALIRPIASVAASRRSDDLLNILRKKQAQIALVKDEEKTAGIVTLEDVLEELVGDIEDEGDVATRSSPSV